MTTRSVHPIHSLAFWQSYLVTARPYLLFVSGAAGLVGLSLSPPPGWVAFLAAFAAFFVAYGLGQALTDTTQTDTDSLSAPYRPLCRGVITARQVAAVSLLGFALCGAVLFALSPWTLALAALGVAGLATYTWFKRRWWAGPAYNSAIVALLPAIGFLCGGSSPRDAMASSRLWLAMGSVFFSYAVFVVLGYLKDISADRATGYDTLPVRFGWGASVAASAAAALSSVVASAALVAEVAAPLGPSPSLSSVLALLLWLAGMAALVTSHVLLSRTRSESEAHAGIGWSVRGFVLLHLGEAASALPALALPALALYLLFELGLAVRPERSQI